MFKTKRPSRKTTRYVPMVKTIFLVSVILGLFISGSILLWFVTLEVPSIDSFHNRKVAESTKIFDRTGKILLYDVHGTVRRTVVPLDDISYFIKNATIAIEDAEFYEHIGIKPTAFLRAVFANIREGRFSQGGSTITQQVVKNTILTPEKTVTRKIKEWILALKLEKQLDKDQILEIYLNETPYGGTIYGVEEASLHFFGKEAGDVSLAEAAYLAALPRAPTYYSPYGNHREDLESRKNLVLEKMLENDFITKEELAAASAEKVEFLKQDDTGIKAPHFVFFIREYLEEKYGVNAVSEQGLQVITTLDYGLQAKAEEIVERNALLNKEKYNAENAGLVAIDPSTGQILTMVGSRGYFDEEIDGKFNIALAKRQPGSSFKPFVYAKAFEKGYTPDTVVFDLKTQFAARCAPNDFTSEDNCYSPDNYDHVFRGPITLRDALAQSVNVPAVKVLYLTGIDAAIDMAKRLGITTLAGSNRYGLTLVLGGGEVTLLDMVSSYSVFANDGVRHENTGVLKVMDRNGKILEEYTGNGQRVIESNIARQISDVLSDNVARTPAFGEYSYLYFPGYDVAAKTGTTNDYRDAWIIGYTPNIAAGAWAGNNDNTPMEKRVAGFIVAPMWNEFMQEALRATPSQSFEEPDIEPSNLPPVLRGIWNIGGEVHSILYWINKDNPRGSRPTDPQKDPQYNLWEYPVLLWNSQNSGGFIPTLPTSSSAGNNNPLVTNTGGSVLIATPQYNSVVPFNTPIDLTISTPNIQRISSVSYYINGNFIGKAITAPFSLSFVPSVKGKFTLEARVEIGGVIELAISEFFVQ